VLFGIFTAITGYVAISSVPGGFSIWPVLAAVVLCAIGALAVFCGRGDPLSASATVVIGLALPTSVILVLITQPHILQMRRPAWLLGTIAILCVILCFRGRIAVAWACFAAVYLVMFGWKAIFDGELVSTAVLVVVPLRLLVGTAFALVLRHKILALRRASQLEAEDQARAAAAEAAQEERVARLSDLDSMVRPMLTRIADGAQLSAADRRACALIEAQLRDQLQAAALANSSVIGYARDARRRGVDVVMIDDGGLAETSDEVRRRVTNHVSEALRTAGEGRLRIRVLPPGRSKLISIYRSEQKSGSIRTDLDVHGDPASEIAC
jgi:hypothetical protein